MVYNLRLGNLTYDRLLSNYTLEPLEELFKNSNVLPEVLTELIRDRARHYIFKIVYGDSIFEYLDCYSFFLHSKYFFTLQFFLMNCLIV